jgi:hypothetical protein
MKREFHDWWKTVSKDEHGKTSIEEVNYVWINEIINNFSNKSNPSVDEILEWIKTCQIDAIRK